MRHAALTLWEVDGSRSGATLRRRHDSHVDAAAHDLGIQEALIIEPDKAGSIWKKRLRSAAEYRHLPRVPFEPGHERGVDNPRAVRRKYWLFLLVRVARELDRFAARQGLDVDLRRLTSGCGPEKSTPDERDHTTIRRKRRVNHRIVEIRQLERRLGDRRWGRRVSKNEKRRADAYRPNQDQACRGRQPS